LSEESEWFLKTHQSELDNNWGGAGVFALLAISAGDSQLELTPMKLLATLLTLAVCGSAYAADPKLEIVPTGTTNNNNKVVITFEVKNLPNGAGINAQTPVAELKVNGNALGAAVYAVSVVGTKGTITITGTLPAGNATIKLKVNLSGGLPAPPIEEKEVDLKMPQQEEALSSPPS